MRCFNAAVIGLGQIGLTYDFDEKRIRPSSHVMAYWMNENIKLKAVMDIREDQKKKICKLGIETNFYTDIEKLLKENNLDIVSICTPAKQHLENIIAVIKNSSVRIIFCEKPIVANLEEAAFLEQFIKEKSVTIIPNISRRWNSGMEEIRCAIVNNVYGNLEKIHVRYTRGIYNTGAHIFDLLSIWCGKIKDVEVFKKIYTTSELENEPSFTFAFNNEDGSHGFFEAFNDKNYYMFEIDLYFSKGKIEVRSSGDEVNYYGVKPHHLFSGFSELQEEKKRLNLLNDAALKNAVSNLVDVLEEKAEPKCVLQNAIYPLYIAKALEKSYQSKMVERVEYI